MVIKAAAVYKNRKAVCFQTYDGPPAFCTYEEMMQLAEELTCFLKSLLNGLQNCVIGLFCQPGIHLLSWILGILQVPAAYCPVDPGAPSNFTSSLADLCEIRYMLVENNKTEFFRQLFPSWIERDSSRVQHLDITVFEALRTEKVNDKDAKMKNDQTSGPTMRPLCDEYLDRNRCCLAYILHTSGTTGKPKIVSVPHCCIVPNIRHIGSIFGMSPNDLVFLASPLTFDPSVIEMFLALSSGACLLIVPEHLKMMPRKLVHVLFQQHRVTVLQVTPTLLRSLSCGSIQSSVLSRETSLRVLALGGEQFPPVSVLRRWMEPGNRTRLFNLYGITEVSSWATFYEIPESLVGSHAGSDPPVPLGRPLCGTIVEVRNEDNNRIEEGEGQVFLGGRHRVCFLDDEFILPCGTMRSTGDWVRLQGGNMYYVGRRDNQFKRHGKRLSAEYIQQVVEELEAVEACAVMWSKAKQLVLFVVQRGSVDKKVLWGAVESNLLSYAVPDDLIVIDTLPFTRHGKLDYSSLSLLYDDHLREKKSKPNSQTRHDFWKSLQTLWKASLGLPEDVPDVAEDSVFLLSGGDSLKAIRFHEDVEALLGKPVPGLLEVILSNTIVAVCRHVIRSVCPEKDEDKTKVHPTEVESNHVVVDMSTKYHSKRKAVFLSRSPAGSSPLLSLSRGSQCFKHICSYTESTGLQCQVIPGSIQDLAFSEFSSPGIKLPKVSPSSTLTLSLRKRWSSDTSKCVDASPLIVLLSSEDSTATVYVGSHSHRMQALDLHTGTVVWERILGERIESSAALSACGNYIIVGCYDGGIYVLRRSNGATLWVFSTGDAVKSSPAIDPKSGLVYVGSHDQHLYALDIEGKQCVWKSPRLVSAVFSSPCINTDPHHLYVATLGGLVLAVDPSTGKHLWKTDIGKPVFSSLHCSDKHVFIGCVDAILYCLSHCGEKLWQFSTEGPIFSSPCVSAVSKHVMFGSHDGFIYCCSTEGELLWKYKANSRVYATPFVFPNPHTENTELLAAASTDGSLWILDAHSGLLITRYILEGEIFSSPVVCLNQLVVGCRNNYVHCFDLISSMKQIGDTESLAMTGSSVT
ncbi:PREDICTED: acyl-CoA synthetase family member 4 [Nanorana parkeri]|uniref:acyl-CoA synthetase family member 4 n=1 Tax=Nanorana parkeri TaxID=125878 RepID=UPI000854674A|nr:PREDICTED: acyl-CoA synthetase family member 4 [Nanorana parkeri]